MQCMVVVVVGWVSGVAVLWYCLEKGMRSNYGQLGISWPESHGETLSQGKK